ncbi:MAG: radical SAM protein [Candidatus Bathyarchaeia archaeon]
MLRSTAMDYPDALQIEVTNRCNFNCQMCIRRVWDAKPADLNLDLYSKIARSTFQYLERLILYGLGEPFLNPSFMDMLRIARENLSKDSEIIVSTNGSMLDQRLIEKILRIGIDNISFSIDTSDAVKLRHIRSGAEPESLLSNFRNMARVKRLSGNSFKLGVEAVLMKSNFMDLPKLVEEAAGEGVDYILVSHVVPYSESMFLDSVYVTISKRSLDIAKPILGYGKKIIADAIYEAFGMIYGIEIEPKTSRIIDEFWREAEENGYWINLPLLFESIGKISIANEVEKVFDLSLKIAREYGVDLRLPNLYPDAKSRWCPYVDRGTMFIRSDGMITPCSEFAYEHTVYVNAHIKAVNPVIFGDSRSENIIDVWNKEEYVAFREVRREMPKNIPWCGDCPYSSSKCFFAETNNFDCYLNKPGCSECLYSVNLAQCNI